MSLYDNQKCPVCGEPFKAGDDVVTCPVCGTPHHRSCYEKLGKCANESLHSQGLFMTGIKTMKSRNLLGRKTQIKETPLIL